LLLGPEGRIRQEKVIRIFRSMKVKNSQCDGQSCFLCRLCLEAWKPAIETNKKTLAFKRGELILSEGDRVEGMYFIRSGTVKVHKKWGEDKEIIIRFATGGDIVGHRGLGKNLFYPISATALEAVTACFVPLDFFWASTEINSAFTRQLILFYAEELQESERNMRNLAHMQVKGRAAQALLTLFNKFGVDKQGDINLALSRQDFASFVGTSYETLFRTLQDLEDHKIIRLSGKKIGILNRPGLEALTGA
jgi:CRP-like cAMP-binding protein